MSDSETKSRFLEIGFVPVELTASVAFPSPRLLIAGRGAPLSRRAVQSCPAVNTFEARAIEVLAPFSLRLRCIRTPRGQFDVHVIDDGTRIDEPVMSKLVTVMPREFWRVENAPVIQVALPHFFISDEICYLTQVPAWASASRNVVPGNFISGRFPTHIWPRSLNLAFEWVDFSQDFLLKRGDPCCYLMVEGPNPEMPIRLFPAALTKELQDYRKSIEDVVKYTSGSFSLMNEAAARRPLSLVREI